MVSKARRGRRGQACLAAWGLCALLSACRKDAATPALHTAAPPADQSTGAEPEAPAPAASLAAGRALWFTEGPGHDAILARERQDHDAAREHLDALLADGSLSPDQRGGAELLRGLEHLQQEQPGEAAARFVAAREAPGLRPIELRLRLWEAEAWLQAGEPQRALDALQAAAPARWSASAVGGDAAMARADAMHRTRDPAGAEAAYRAYLKAYPKGSRRYEARTKLARLLAERDDDKSRREALQLFDQVRRDVPLSDYADEAEGQVATLERALGPLREGAEAKAFARELELSQAEAMLSRHRYARAVKAVDALVAKGKLSAAQRCRAYFVKGSAIFKQRRRADARGSFDQAADECAKAGKAHETTRVKSRYQGARGWYAAGKYAKAGQAFEALAADHPRHSYADDALVLAGESWESHGDPERAARAYRKALDDHPGDMAHEARRRLLVMHFAAGRNEDALQIIDRALSTKIVRPVERAKLHYFRGRALDGLGRGEQAEQAWLAAVGEAPLSYPALQALSRLRERERLDEGLARLQGAAGQPSVPASSGEAARRATVLAQLGLGPEARSELEHGEIDGWPAVVVLNQAGLYPAAQIELANLGTRWRAEPPGEANRWRWEGAHPRPFVEIIEPGEPEHLVPALLTYAIMQTESRFDPGVTSFAGAKGLVQLMPGTARGLAKRAGVSLDGPAALHDPALNLDLGMRYLGRLAARYDGGDGAVALAIPSYNAGEGSVDRWLGERGEWDLDLFVESIPYDETRKYTQSVLGRWMSYRWLYGQGAPQDRVPYLPRETPRKASRK